MSKPANKATRKKGLDSSPASQIKSYRFRRETIEALQAPT